MAMVNMITAPPVIVSMLGCSLITIHTKKGQMIVSNKKNRLTSSAGINLGAMVTRTKGIATHMIHIKGMIYKSRSTRAYVSIKNIANTATNNFPTTAAGTKFFFLADLIVTAPTANPKAVISPNKSP